MPAVDQGTIFYNKSMLNVHDPLLLPLLAS
jgi:hypothetical protein